MTATGDTFRLVLKPTINEMSLSENWNQFIDFFKKNKCRSICISYNQVCLIPLPRWRHFIKRVLKLWQFYVTMSQYNIIFSRPYWWSFWFVTAAVAMILLILLVTCCIFCILCWCLYWPEYCFAQCFTHVC